MKRASVGSVLILATLLVSAFAFIATSSPAHAVSSPSVAKCALPAGSNSESLATDGIWLYYFSNTYGSIFKVNPSTCAYSTLAGITGTHNWAAGYFYRQSLWMVDSASNGGGLYSYNLTTSAFGLVPFGSTGGNTISSSMGQMLVASQCSTASYNFTQGLCGTWDSVRKVFNSQPTQNFWYTMHQNGADAQFDKIEYLKDVSASNPAQYWDFPYTCSTNVQLCGLTGPFLGLAQDKYGDVMVTAQGSGCLIGYNATQNSMSKWCGFTSPAGVAVSGYDAYVAQNTLNGGVADFNLRTHSLKSTSSTPSSTPFGVSILQGNVVWSSSGSDGNICTLALACSATGEQNYYLLPLSNGNLAGGYIGSSGIEVVSGLTSASPGTTTTSTGTSLTTATITTVISGTLTTTTTATTSSTDTSYIYVRDAVTHRGISATLTFSSASYTSAYNVINLCSCIAIPSLPASSGYSATASAAGYANVTIPLVSFDSSYIISLLPFGGGPVKGTAVQVSAWDTKTNAPASHVRLQVAYWMPYSNSTIVSSVILPLTCSGTLGDGTIVAVASCPGLYRQLLASPGGGMSCDEKCTFGYATYDGPLAVFNVPHDYVVTAWNDGILAGGVSAIVPLVVPYPETISWNQG